MATPTPETMDYDLIADAIILPATLIIFAILFIYDDK